MLTLSCLLAAAAAAGFAWVQDQSLRRRDALYLAVEREAMSFINDSARSDVDERMEVTRRLRDGALGVGAILLVTPVLLGLARHRNARVRSAGGKGGGSGAYRNDD
jgi:hypothetical protein